MVLDKKLICITLELATADYIVHSIHAFTIHVALLILSKGILYARNSRLVSDKLELGFRYPCDGPGRGGTCQISPWDHLYLAVFWMYNSLNTIIFHYFWKMQSDVWGIYNQLEHSVAHISQADYCVHATSINGWFRLMSCLFLVVSSSSSYLDLCHLHFWVFLHFLKCSFHLGI